MGEVREGYKMTELGEIPREWGIYSVKEISNKIGDGNYSSKYPKASEFVDKGIPFLRANNLKNSKIINSDMRYISETLHEELRKGHLKTNDIIISVRGQLGQIGYVTDFFNNTNINAQLAFIRTNENASSKYIFYYFQSNRFIEQISKSTTGTALLQLPINRLEKIKVVLPNIIEQQKIASILSTLDEQIDETEQLIVKTKELKKGLMQQLLTKGIGHTEFKQTELGEIPSSWQVKKIGDCIDVLGGYAFKSKDAQEFGSRWLKIANVGIGKIRWDDASYLPEDYLEEFHDYQIEYGDIVMAMTRPVLNGKLKIAVYKNEEPSLLNQRVCKFDMLNGVVDKSYFYQLATSIEFSQNIDYLIAGTDPPNVSSQQIKSIIIRVPSIEEQQKIAQILSTVDEQIEVYEQEKAKYEELKKGLMQQLLTGQIRVKI